MPDQARCGRCATPLPPGARQCAVCGADVPGWEDQAATAHLGPGGELGPPAGQADQRDALRRATLGEYDIQGKLGQGGMAAVYLAHDIALNRKVAIKVMAPALFAVPGMVERFKREARTAAALSHPNVVPIYAVRESRDVVYFVMKFISGRSLESVLRAAGPLPLPLVRAVLYQVGEALGYAHQHDVVHRDIKPANIMLDRDGWVLVTDFGIAKVAETTGLTMTGAAVGTPSYMSPEQCEAKRTLTGASDQYSLGIVAYEMLTGRLPFDADTALGLLYAQVHEPPPPVTDFRSDCPAETAAALMRMLAKDPGERWPDIGAAVAALGSAPPIRDDPVRAQLAALARAKGDADVRLAATPISPLPPPRPPRRKPPAAPPRPRRPIPRAVWVGAVGLLALAAWRLATRPHRAAWSEVQTSVSARRSRVSSPDSAGVARELRVPRGAAPAADGASPWAGVEETVAALARALESRSLARVRQVYPALSAQQAEAWDQFFRRATQLRVSLRTTSLEQFGDRANAAIEGSIAYRDLATGRSLERPVALRGSFARDAGAWHLTSLR